MNECMMTQLWVTSHIRTPAASGGVRVRVGTPRGPRVYVWLHVPLLLEALLNPSREDPGQSNGNSCQVTKRKPGAPVPRHSPVSVSRPLGGNRTQHDMVVGYEAAVRHGWGEGGL